MSKTHLRFTLFLFVISLAGTISCQKEDAEELYNALFKESDPPFSRDQVIGMLKNLRKLHRDDDKEAELIDEVLEKSEVTKEKCRRSGREFFLAYSGFSGRVDQLLKESQDLQATFCLPSWNTSLSSLVNEIDGSDKDLVDSMIRSMIDANSGADFDGIWFEMPYKNAQEGVLHFMEKETGNTYSKGTKQEDFDEAFNKLVFEPCGRIVSKLSRDADRYIYFFRSTDLASHLDSNLLEWAKKNQICKQLQGSGYSSSSKFSFRQDIFQNLANRKKPTFFNRLVGMK